MKNPKLVLLLIAAGMVTSPALLAQTSIAPGDSSTVLDNRNSTPADLERSGNNASDNVSRDRSAKKAAVEKTLIGRLGAGDKKFVQQDSVSGATEIEAAKLAQTNSSNPRVKEFASHMITDHTKLSATLNTVLAKQNVEVEMAKPDAATIDSLKSLQGAEFDKAYVQKAGIEGHDNAIELFTQESIEGENPALKAAAKEALPTIKHHRKMVDKLAKSLDSSPAGAAKDKSAK